MIDENKTALLEQTRLFKIYVAKGCYILTNYPPKTWNRGIETDYVLHGQTAVIFRHKFHRLREYRNKRTMYEYYLNKLCMEIIKYDC